MKTRLTPLAAAISCLSMLTACGGSGPGTVDAANVPSTPSATPTVTVTAPATATAGAAFDVAWTSTDTTSCSADFSTKVNTSSGSVSQTVAVVGTASVTKTYMVTCTGAGGSASNSTSVVVSPNATAQGAWQGMVGVAPTQRALSGVVTDQGNYWLAYSSVADPAVPAGFYAGSGVATNGGFPSQNLREFNFEGGGAEQGALAATYTQSVGYTSANTLAGSFEAVSVSSVYQLTMTSNSYFSGLGGDLVFENFTGSWNAATGAGTWSGRVYSAADPAYTTTPVPMDLNFTQTFSMPTTTGMSSSGYPDQGTLNPFDVATCFNNLTGVSGADGDGSCIGFSGPLAGQLFNTDGITQDVPLAFTPADGLHLNWVLQVYLAGAHGALTYTPLPMDVTLHAQSLPSITTAAFTSTYDSSYEETPSLTTISGSYTAGSTGIDTAMHADASLTIASDGSIVGTEASSHCDYSGTVAPHATAGNVYDVTLTFAGSNGSGGGAGGCVYDSETFTGIATAVVDTSVTPNTTKLTITAVNSARDKGFMVVATK